jgi:hypothetical protein
MIDYTLYHYYPSRRELNGQDSLDMKDVKGSFENEKDIEYIQQFWHFVPACLWRRATDCLSEGFFSQTIHLAVTLAYQIMIMEKVSRLLGY